MKDDEDVGYGLENSVVKHFKDRLETSTKYTGPPQINHLPEDIDGIYVEAGCGTRVSWDPKENSIIGIDIVPEMIKQFHYTHKNTHLVLGDVLNLPLRGKTITSLSAYCILHHLIGRNKKQCYVNIKKALKEFNYSVKEKGMMLITEYLTSNNIYRDFMYYVTLICSKLNINIKSFDIEDRLVVHFLEKSEMFKFLTELNYDFSLIKNRPWKINGIKLGEISSIHATKKK